jgi:hypothetical protein
MRTLALLTAATLLCACSTGYHSVGFTGGYWEKDGPGELIEVGFSANGFSDTATVGVYLMRRCGEVAQERGKPYFTIYNAVFEAIAERPSDDSFVSSVTGRPNGKVFMLLHDQKVPGAFRADEVLTKYGSDRATEGGAQ